MRLRRKMFSSFMERMKGNSKLRESLINYSKKKGINTDIFNDCSEFKKFDKNIQSYLTWLSENIISGAEPITFSGVRLVLLGYDKIIDGITKGKSYFIGESKPKDPRVVFGWIDAGQGSVIVLYYDIKKDVIILRKETLKYMLITKAINKLFKEKELSFKPSEIFDVIMKIQLYIL